MPTIFLGAPVAQPAPTKFGTKVVIVTYSPNRSCVPILKLLASTIAERSRGPKFFQCSLVQTPASFCPKSCFLASYCPRPSCIANMNFLASINAKINTGVPFFGCSPSPDPCQLVQNLGTGQPVRYNGGLDPLVVSNFNFYF